MNKSLSSRIGRTLAHIQDLIDTVFHAIFKRGKDISIEKKGSKVVGFFSEIGDAFYREYSELKQEKQTKEKSE